ncbi:MAG TPA: hypothetical protein VFZ59_17855 [Verrucomicrobiae bacterium]|nr:hypothetical protein [Verrucomicrobiae bacterium]
MKRLPDDVPDQTSERKEACISIVTTETTSLSHDLKDRVPDERELEAEMERRASAFTAVLTRIIENPAVPRYWGLNE